LHRLEEAELDGTVEGDPARGKALERCRDVYERAIANVPPLPEKRYWRRYVYLWIGYAVFEELYGPPALPKQEQGGSGHDEGCESGIARARAVYKGCLGVIPHKRFTFCKIWLQAAHLEVRAKDLTAARKLLGRAIGEWPACC
jgi:crooked neck